MKIPYCVLLLFLPVLPANGQVKSFADLMPDDWFTLEYATFYDSVPDEFWRAEEIRKTKVKASVVKKSKNTVTLSFKPVHFYENNSYGNRSYWFYDSHFPNLEKIYTRQDTRFLTTDGVSSQNFTEAMERDSLVITIDLKSGAIKDTVYAIHKDLWIIVPQTTQRGMRKGYDRVYSSSHFKSQALDAKEQLRNAVLPYISQWADNMSKGKPQPQIVCLSENQISGFRKPTGWSQQHAPAAAVRISGASFELPPNVTLIYKGTSHGKQPVLSPENKNITFGQQADGSVCSRFFLPEPRKIAFDGITLCLSPGDSIYIEKDETGEYSFSGKGAAACRYARDMKKAMRRYRNGFDEFIGTPSKADADRRLRNMDSIYRKLWDEHRNGMDEYWMRVSQLSYKYWYASVCLKYFVAKTLNRQSGDWLTSASETIPWDSEPFTTIIPSTDYLYQPDGYHNFLEAFYRFKLTQLGQDNLTIMPYPRTGNDFEYYYLQRQIFAGYPKFYLMSASLRDVMQTTHLSACEREYNDFMQLCYHPGLRKEMNTLHRQLMQIEPGRKIQDINPELAALPLFKDKPDGYIMLNSRFRSFEWDLSWNDNLWKAVRQAGLSGQVKAIALRPSGYAGSLPDSIKITDNSLKLSNDFFKFFDGEFILIRNDGTVVSRNFSGNSFWNLKDVIKEDIAIRDEEPEQNNGKIILIILSAILLTAMITFAAAGVRMKIIRRREKNKRMIAELELKAIRSQMNPHFVFNALGSIQSLINQEKTTEANHYLVNFAKLLRMVLSSSEKKLVTLAGELKQLDLYLQLEQLRVPFEYDINVYDNVCPDEEEIPGMLIQPVVENAVIHGIVPRQGGHISICIRKEDNILFVDVADDGLGIPAEALEKNGFGLRAINERLALLNDELKTDIGLKIENRQEKESVSGTRVTISIPV